jgi:hypothetical protein
MWAKLKYRVLIAASAQAFAQLNGINVISYYAPLVFESAGWIGRAAVFFAGINGTSTSSLSLAHRNYQIE